MRLTLSRSDRFEVLATQRAAEGIARTSALTVGTF
jgi:hypothetical protein